MVQKILRKLSRSSDNVMRNHARGMLVRLSTVEVCRECELAECVCDNMTIEVKTK